MTIVSGAYQLLHRTGVTLSLQVPCTARKATKIIEIDVQGSCQLTTTHHWRSAECGRHVSVLQEAGEAKVGNLQDDVGRRWQRLAAVVRQQDVLWFQISMHDSLGEERSHGPG